MITRRVVRASLVCAGTAVGALSLLAYLLCLSWEISYDGGPRLAYLGRGALVVQWELPGIQAPNPAMPSAFVVLPRPGAGWSIGRPGPRPWRWLPHWVEPV